MAMTNDEAQNEQAGPSELSGGVRTSHFGFRSSRRKFVATAALGIASLTLPAAAPQDSSARRALIAVTFDLEMARNFPRWEDTHWDYEKGNLNEETKRYAVEAGRRVKAHGGVIHYFVVGRVFEQENVDWLKRLVEDGHPVGNHTYDHVNLKATKAEETREVWIVRHGAWFTISPREWAGVRGKRPLHTSQRESPPLVVRPIPAGQFPNLSGFTISSLRQCRRSLIRNSLTG